MISPHTTGVWMTADSATILRWSAELTVQQGDEGHRDEHMRISFDEVAHAIPLDDDLLLIGDGEVVEHFADRVRTDDDNLGRERRIGMEKSGPVTERQLLARIRTFAGSPAKRYLPR